ncbi:OPT oligopeptide transporter protein-domain-containing protein [Chytridium lagenaria]|nr:OPT oligopeptide transporter protein-domain-containing protein [Chytridium lagenaria]
MPRNDPLPTSPFSTLFYPKNDGSSPTDSDGKKRVPPLFIDDEEEDYIDEIYDIVDAVVSRSDDPTLPASTFRAWFLGLFFCSILAAANTLFSFRTNMFHASLSLEFCWRIRVDLFMAAVLPTTKFRVFGWDMTLNPGRFNHKEHALIYVFCNSGANTAYALYNIIGQKFQLYQEDLSLTASIVFAIVTQIFGYGLAGLCRRFLVRPSAMLWPGNLSIVALLNSLHRVPILAYDTTPSSTSQSRFVSTGSQPSLQPLPSPSKLHYAGAFHRLSVMLCRPLDAGPGFSEIVGSAMPDGGLWGGEFVV